MSVGNGEARVATIASVMILKLRLSPFIAVPVIDILVVEKLVVEKRDQDDNRYRNPEKPKQKGTAHIILLGATQARILSRQEHSLALICSRGGKHHFMNAYQRTRPRVCCRARNFRN